MKTQRLRSAIILWSVLLGVFLWLAVKFGMVLTPGVSLAAFKDGFIATVKQPFVLEITSRTGTFASIFLIAWLCLLSSYLITYGNYRHGEEHGSADWERWARISKEFEQEHNKILSRLVKLGLDYPIKNFNLNTLIIGGPGSGKTFGFVKPNVLELNSNYVITDPKGEILKSTGSALEADGYTIKVLDLSSFPDISHSHFYNPFRYLRNENDVIKMVESIIENTTEQKGPSTDGDFWVKGEKLLLESLVYYLWSEAPTYEQNFSMVMTMLRYLRVSEESGEQENAVDLLFKDLEKEKPEHIAVLMYKGFRNAPGKTALSMIISLFVRLQHFNNTAIAELTSDDEMELEKITTEKMAIFCLIPDNTKSYNFLAGILYTQIIDVIWEFARHAKGECSERHVAFILDEFANVAKIQNFEGVISICRSKNVSMNIIIQNIAQLKTMFPNNVWESVVGCCSSMLYLGGNEAETWKYVSNAMGKSTILYTGLNKGWTNTSTNYNIVGRELMTPDEVRALPKDECIMLLYGVKPLKDKKFNLLHHRNIRLAAEGGATPFTFQREQIKKAG